MAAAVTSVLDQRGPDVEVVVVDDGSTDDTAEVLAQWSHHPRVRVCHHPVNRGVSAAINTGMAHTTGTSLTLMGADDVLAPGYLADLVAGMGDDVDIVVGGHTAIHPGGGRTPVPQANPGRYPGALACRMMLENRIGTLAGGKLIRRDLALRVPYPVGLRRYEDLAVSIALPSHARFVRVVESVGYLYTVRETSATWGRHPTVAEFDTAIEHIHTQLAPQVFGRRVSRALKVLHLWGLLVVAHSPMMVPGFPAAARDLVKQATSAITWSDLAATLSTRPDLAAAGALARFAPRMYRRLYLRHVRRSYGLSAC